ncbi:AfsR/SARP family transcriptional regulator [Actinomadura physcomitrii]|uniref:AfsR/SARP family transcriptional regulator n=1 Tax=Actinomadura physcomitrii TaxID=2650748 RepID=UPI00136A10BC|nr:BTAD domain-containing putative transcriptional regulator [Actinomadura physcomitrii]
MPTNVGSPSSARVSRCRSRTRVPGRCRRRTRRAARCRAGEHAAVAAELAPAVAEHPLRERLRAAHLRALHGAGRRAEALAGYHDLRERLADELGVDPGPELASLYRSMLEDDPSKGPGPRTAPRSPLIKPV